MLCAITSMRTSFVCASNPLLRSVSVNTRFIMENVEQKAAIVAAAERDGLELSAWLRQLALRAAGVLPKLDARR